MLRDHVFLPQQVGTPNAPHLPGISKRMITERFMRGLKVVTYKTRAPRSMGSNIKADIRKAQSSSFIAASDYENALMDKNEGAAFIARLRSTRNWIRNHGAYCAKHIPRPRHIRC